MKYSQKSQNKNTPSKETYKVTIPRKDGSVEKQRYVEVKGKNTKGESISRRVFLLAD